MSFAGIFELMLPSARSRQRLCGISSQNNTQKWENMLTRTRYYLAACVLMLSWRYSHVAANPGGAPDG